jgi:uncharacterized membrane protein
MLHRLMLLVAALTAMVALAASPAFAQDDDDDGGGDDDDGAGQVAPAPQGGVQTGAGGTAHTGPDSLALAMAGGSMLLVMTAGGFVLRRREAE